MTQIVKILDLFFEVKFNHRKIANLAGNLFSYMIQKHLAYSGGLAKGGGHFQLFLLQKIY